MSANAADAINTADALPALTTIRVVEARRAFVDLATIPLEELTGVAERIQTIEFQRPSSGGGRPRPIRFPWQSVMNLALALRVPKPAEDSDPTIAARLLFQDESFRPIVSHGAPSLHQKPRGANERAPLRVRPVSRIEGFRSGAGFSPKNTIGVAADDVIHVKGIHCSAENGHILKTELNLENPLPQLSSYIRLSNVLSDYAAMSASASTHVEDISLLHCLAPPEKDPPVTYPLLVSYFMTRLAKTGAVISLAPTPYHLAPHYDFYRLGALNIFQDLLAHGRESTAVDDHLAHAAAAAERVRALERLAQNALDAEMLAASYREIIEEKQFVGRNSDSTDPAVLLRGLAPKDRAVVEQTYALRNKELEANLSNKCPHLRLVRRMRMAKTVDEALDLLMELERYFDHTSPKSALIRCRSCGRGTICPHVAVLVRLNARRAPYDEVRSTLVRFASTKVRDDLYSYYCRVCSERLAELFEEDRSAEMGRFGNLDTELRSLVWGELVACAELLRAPTAIDPRQFASSAVDAVYPLVLGAEMALGKSERRTYENKAGERTLAAMPPRLHLYAILFAYAYTLNLVVSSPHIAFEGARAGAKAASIAEAMLAHIITARRGIISQIVGITTDFISARFTEAYRLVQNNVGAITVKPVDAAEELAIQLTELIPTYSYAVIAARVLGGLRLRAGPAQEFETVMGMSLPALVKLLREHFPVVSGRTQLRRGKNALQTGSVSNFNMFEKIWRPKNYKAVLDRSSGAATPADMQRLYFEASYCLFVEYCLISDAASAAAHVRHLAIVRRGEELFQLPKRISAVVPTNDFGFRRTLAFVQERIPMNLLYDESGLPHRWTIFVYANGLRLKRGEFSRREGSPLVDMECSVCKILRSKASELDEAKVEKSLLVANKIDLLFSFYESRCPKGDLHMYGLVDGVEYCAKCGLRGDLIRARQASEQVRLGAESRKYYDTYEAEFQIERNILIDSSAESAGTAELAVVSSPATIDAQPPAADYGVLVRAAELGGVPVSVVEALGATEGRDYEEIRAGTAPSLPAPENIDDARIANVQALTRMFVARNARKLDMVKIRAPTPAQQLSAEIQRLCALALELNDKAQWQQVLRSDKLFSKPGPFSFGIFTETEEGALISDDPEEPDVAPSGDTFTTFSLEHMDYDGSNG